MPLRTFDLRDEVCYEDALERCCLVVGRLRPDIVKVAEQPPSVTYIDDDGRKRRHVFDFRFTTTEGKRLLAAVKPSALIAVSGIDRIVELVAEQISPSVADFLVLLTEEKLSQVDLFNVQVVNMAARDLSPENDAALAKVIRKMNRQASIGELVEKSTLGGYGYDAVVRAVAGGQLRLVEYCKLDFDTLLTRAPKGKARVLLAQTLVGDGGVSVCSTEADVTPERPQTSCSVNLSSAGPCIRCGHCRLRPACIRSVCGSCCGPQGRSRRARTV